MDPSAQDGAYKKGMFPMRAVSALLFATLMWGQVTPVLAGFIEGNELHDYCQQAVTSQICTGYIVGIADALADGATINGFRACFRSKMLVKQVEDVVKQWLQNHPQDRDYAAAGLVADALQGAFPCAK